MQEQKFSYDDILTSKADDKAKAKSEFFNVTTFHHISQTLFH